jgi:predicted GIY-YIG superfamily endonuclease
LAKVASWVIKSILKPFLKVKPAKKLLGRRKGMAEENSLTVGGASGVSYVFWAYPWDTSFKSEGGVYLVLRKAPNNGNYNVLYVGQTANLSERFDNHHKKPCFDRYGKTHIAVRVENSEKNRLGIEADLIQNYRPNWYG